ncbi:MAG: hypothetical protein K2X77_19410 [Candidatus Obscuribacterales bacterium]|jgi:hypothetical protein|nr:hypothetical protein [Candidatus Obscuribacterales bacterium]
MQDLETKFRHLEIFPGVAMPITHDQRAAMVAAVVSGDFAGAQAMVAELKVGDWNRMDGDLFTFLRDLFGMTNFFSAEDVLDELFDRRAAKFGLPANTDRATILAAEQRTNRCLTIGELRRLRADRLGESRALLSGQW